jgi:hypothetical protein
LYDAIFDMKGPSKTPDSKLAPAALLAALTMIGLGFAGCRSSAKPASTLPTVANRVELPAVRTPPAGIGTVSSAAPPAPAPPAFPRTLALSALAEGERIADLAVLPTEGRYLLAWVTYFDGGGPSASPAPRAPSKKAAPPKAPQKAAAPGQKLGATVAVRALDQEGETLGEFTVISVKGVSIGGVSLAPSASAQGDAALAWVGKDAGVGQVFVTRISRTADKQAQRMITRSKEGCSDVALVRHNEGFVVAYVDSRDGKAGVYLMRMGKNLEPLGAERNVARAFGEASDVRMLARGDELVIAWAETRQNPEAYGVFAARLLAADLSLRGDPTRVVLSPHHTKGIELGTFGDGVALGWIEDAEAGPAAQPTDVKSVALARLDPQLRPTAAPIRMALPGRASSLTFECDGACRVVVAGAEGDDLTFYGFLFEGAVPSAAARLASIPGVSTEDTTPIVTRDWLFFAEDNLHGAGRIRKAKLAWR